MRKHLSKIIAAFALLAIVVGGFVLVSGYASPRTRYPWKDALDPAMTLAARIQPLEGYERVQLQRDSFGHWLRNLPLKPADAKVLRFDGTEWPNGAWSAAAVVDIDTGDTDRQRAAQSVARLRAEYLYGTGDRQGIRFTLTDGSTASFMQWSAARKRDLSHDSLRAFLDDIAPQLTTASLMKGMTPVKLADVRPGDVFLRGGALDGAVIVVDMAVDPRTRGRILLLAHGDAPAQDIHIINNAVDEKHKPWFSITPPPAKLQTPEGEYQIADLRRF